jgi:ABC-type oligopeptide transport system ATPase subunit
MTKIGGLVGKAGVVRALECAADEPVSSLDVSIRAAITKLLTDIQRNRGTTLLVIGHVLGLVRYMADRVVVMYLGQGRKSGTTEEVFSAPWHPYTEALLSAIPPMRHGDRASCSRVRFRARFPRADVPSTHAVTERSVRVVKRKAGRAASRQPSYRL